MKKHNKLKIAVVISVISVIIAIISLSFSIYMNMREIQYKDYMKQLQESSQELQKKSLDFDQNYKKIDLAEKSIYDQIDICKENINQEELSKDLKLLNQARDSLMKNDYMMVQNHLNQVQINNICNRTITKNRVIYEILALVIIWVLLIISYFRIINVRKKK